MSVKNNPVLYSGFIDSLQKQSDKTPFSKRYSRFKKRCRCQSLQQVVQVSKQHLSKEDDVEDLKQVLDGLRMIKREYPECSFLKKVMVLFNRQYRTSREKALVSLDSTIQQYEKKIRALESVVPEKSPLSELDIELIDLDDKVKELLSDKIAPRTGQIPFSQAASAAVKRIVETGRLPADEYMALLKKELNALVKKYGSREVCQDDVFAAMLLKAGKNQAPRLIRQLDRIRREEPGLVFPDIAQGALDKQAQQFASLAKTIRKVFGEDVANGIDLEGNRYAKPEVVAEVVDPIVDLKADQARGMVQQMRRDNRDKNPQKALERLTGALLAQFEGSKESEESMQMSILPTKANIDKLAELFVATLADDEGDAFSAFAMLLDKAMGEAEIGALDRHARQLVLALVDAMNTKGSIDLSDGWSERNQAYSAIRERIQQGSIRAKEELEGVKKHAMSDLITVIENLDGKEDFSDFASRLLIASKNGRDKEDLQAIYELSVVIKDYIDSNLTIFQVDGSTVDYSDVMSALFYQLQVHDPDKFSQFVLDLLVIKERNPDLQHTFLDYVYKGISFVGGVDLRNVTVVEDVLLEEENFDVEKVSILEENLVLFEKHNKWLATMDRNSPPDGVESGVIKDAIKLQRLFNHPEFKGDVETMLQDYLNQDPFSSTEDNRRVIVKKMNPILSKYTGVMIPGEEILGGDDLLPFVQAVLAANPKLGARVLLKTANENEDVIRNTKIKADMAFFTMHTFRDYFMQQENFLTEPFRKQL